MTIDIAVIGSIAGAIIAVITLIRTVLSPLREQIRRIEELEYRLNNLGEEFKEIYRGIDDTKQDVIVRSTAFSAYKIKQNEALTVLMSGLVVLIDNVASTEKNTTELIKARDTVREFLVSNKLQIT
ncbi:hypothetical protein FACS18948_6550 [Clostridia bacterium]|nr:hypothetical protein FACS18948_6550 [Clostridia bacterium]